MNNLNNKIVEILKKHPEGGEKFFDALDLKIRSDTDILNDYISWVKSYYGHNACVGVIVTGSFGRTLVSCYGKWLFSFFSDLIIVNGGIRSSGIVDLPIVGTHTSAWVLLDDSYYSGKTMNAIEESLQAINPKAQILKAFVVYDGSKERNEKVLGMYRYYDKKDGHSS